MKTGGQLVVEALESQRVERVFCVPGESYLAVLDALHDSPIKTTVCRQEGGSAIMAEAWGKLTGTPGVCFVTRGPGATNAAAAVHIARHDSTPLILFVGQIESGSRHREAFQEIDYRHLFGDLTKWVAEIDSAARVPEVISRAWHVATAGRPGPVVLVLPEDTLIDQSEAVAMQRCQPTETHPGAQQIAEFNAMLQAAERPLAILGGSGWTAAAVQQFSEFATRFELPVACSFRRQSLIDHLHPCYAGDVGLDINPALLARIQQADVLLLAGCRLPEIPSQNYTLIDIPYPRQKLIHVHPGSEELGKVYQPALSIHSSPVAFCAAIASLSPTRAIKWQGQSRIAHGDYEYWSALDRSHPSASMMRAVMQHLQEALAEDAVLTNGAGNYSVWVHRFWKFRQFGSQLAPTSGSMGYGLPAAIAAKLHSPEKTVIAFAGDGCFQMTMQEFGTAVQENAAVIVLVLDNGMYGTIRMHQEKFFPGRVSATTLLNPDFAMLAKSYGVYSATVTRPEEFSEAFSAARDSAGPALIDIKIDAQAITPTQLITEL